MKVLFVGDLNEYGRTFKHYYSLLDMDYEIDSVSTIFVPRQAGIDETPILEKLFEKLRFPLDVTSANKKIKQLVSRNKYDIIWVEKGNTIRPSTLKFIKKHLPAAKLISVSEDNMYVKHNNSHYYVCGVKYYDVVFTTKAYNLEELKEFGVKKTKLFLDAYDEKLHRPLELSSEDREKYGCDVSFIGTFEVDRANKMLYLAENGIPVVIWGNGWNKWRDKHQNLIIQNKPLYDEEYVKAINATKINLCFLRKINRDEVTSRSVEIPACGGFLLGERTQRHLEFFNEGKEAEFFSSDKEMLDKLKYYLSNDSKRQKIAERGRRRSVESGYGIRNQIRDMFSGIV